MIIVGYIITITIIIPRKTGWWYTYPSEKFVSWDDDIPNIWKNEINVPNHQPGIKPERIGINLHAQNHFHQHEWELNQQLGYVPTRKRK
jgi:hypothetical protein